MIFERVAGERYSRILPTWKGKTAVLIAGGPSLTKEQVDLVRVAREEDRVRVIAINDSYLIAPWADAHFAADDKWHRWHQQGVDKPVIGLKADEVRLRWKSYRGERSTCMQSVGAVDDSVHAMRCHHPDFGLSFDPTWLKSGKHGGFQALNIATLAGATTVILLGYDAKSAPDGMRHWHGEHPTHTSRDDIYGDMRRSFKVALPEIQMAGVRVLNCSTGSAIDAFPMADLEEALEGVAA